MMRRTWGARHLTRISAGRAAASLAWITIRSQLPIKLQNHKTAISSSPYAGVRDWEIMMNGLRAGLIAALAVAGCDSGVPTYSQQGLYDRPAYYGSPLYSPGYGPGAGYAVPYGYPRNGYQPGYAAPYAHDPSWGQRQNQQAGGPPRGLPPPAAAPAAAAPPPAARTPDQNKQLIDQLGFRPSH